MNWQGRAGLGLPMAPPPPELVERALETAASRGLQIDFTSTISERGLLVWSVVIITRRGTIRGVPQDLTADAWLTVLNEMGLLR